MPTYRSPANPYHDVEQLERLGALGVHFYKQQQEKRQARLEREARQAEMVMAGVASGQLDPDSAVVQSALESLAQVDPQTARIHRALAEAKKQGDVLGYMEREADKVYRRTPQVPLRRPTQTESLQDVYGRLLPSQQGRVQQQMIARGMSPKELVPAPPEEEGLPKLLESASQGLRDPYIAQKLGLKAPAPAMPDISTLREAEARFSRGELTPEEFEIQRKGFAQEALDAAKIRAENRAASSAATAAVTASGVKSTEVTSRVRLYLEERDAAMLSGQKLKPLTQEAMAKLISLAKIQLSFESAAPDPFASELALEEYDTRTTSGEVPKTVFYDIYSRLKSGKFYR